MKDIHRENALTNKTQVLTNMGIWVTITLNQLFTRGSYTELKFSKQ